MQATYGKQLRVQPRFNPDALDFATGRNGQNIGFASVPEQAKAKPGTNGLARSVRSLREALAQSTVYREYADAANPPGNTAPN